MELSETLRGYFNVRQYTAGKERSQWRLFSESENISFTTTFDVCPEKYSRFARQYQDKNGNTRYAVTFKISMGRTEFYDRTGHIDKPDNSVLDGKLYEVLIQYNEVVPKDPNNKLAARGYWANAIYIAETNDNPFADLIAAPTQPIQQQPIQQQPIQQQPIQQQPIQQQPIQQQPIQPTFGTEDNLPF